MLTAARALQGIALIFWAVALYTKIPIMALAPSELAQAQKLRPEENAVAATLHRGLIFHAVLAAAIFTGLLLEHLLNPVPFGALAATLALVGGALGLFLYLHRTTDLQLARLWSELRATALPDGTIPDGHPARDHMARHVRIISRFCWISWLLVMLALIVTFGRFQ